METVESNVSSPSLPLQSYPQQTLYRYSIDVLSNGTEYTSGNAHSNGVTIPALFLSIWKVTTASTTLSSDADVDYEGNGLLLARYGLSGVGSCDGLARIAADQQYKLGPLRAVFFIDHSCDSSSSADNHETYSPPSTSILSDVASLPSILYACQQESLSLIVPNPNDVDRVEQLVQLVHGNHAYPKVLLCSVPKANKEGSSSRNQQQWWKVFEDDHIIVHAARWSSISNDDRKHEVGIIYLFTFQRLVQQRYSIRSSIATTIVTCPDSILILPSVNTFDQQLHSITTNMMLTLNLPVIEIKNTNNKDTVIDHQTTLLHTYVLATANTTNVTKNVNPIRTYNTSHSILINHDRGTEPAACVSDPDLLVRGRQQTLSWRQCCDASLVQHFPFRSERCSISHTTNTDTFDCPATKAGLSNTSCHDNAVWLRTGTSLMFEVRSSTGPTSRIIDRNVLREHRRIKNGRLHKNGLEANESLAESRDSWPIKMKEFLLQPAMSTTATNRLNHDNLNSDENEIDLDIDDTTNDDCNRTCRLPSEDDVPTDRTDNKPQLLILGTGCASPSPYRSASGYALIIPRKSVISHGTSSTIIAVEVGESFCTQFHRYGEGRSLTEIQMIWISHAHWDHYGGLVNLLLQIQQIHGRNNAGIVERQQKRIKLNSNNVPYSELLSNKAVSTPFVVAPPKVLKYLRLVFDNPGLFYEEIQMQDTAAMDKALQSVNEQNQCLLRWINVRVDHSCLSFGFIMVLQVCETPFVIVFSGDTRPCKNLVDQCRTLTKHYKANKRVDFLLHEATFDDNELNMSITKKHSTVSEAVMVGRDIDAIRLLLTHFSQRYDHVPTLDVESARYDGRMNIGFALDGMKVFL